MGENNNNNEENLLTSWSCCNDDQTVFLLLYIAYIAIALLTWKSVLAKPIRLVAVFIHEWCHAIACWMTCGDVRKINVFENEGGVTTFVGGCRCLIIPAGYVGCSICSMIFVILSGGRKASLVGCILFTLSLLAALCYSPNKLTVALCLGYTLVNLGVAILDYYWYPLLLQCLFLYYGVTIGIFSIADTYDDTVLRSSRGSDSVACSREVWPCCPPQCIGFQWALLTICFQCIGMWFALVGMSPECEDLSWMNCMDPEDDGIWDVWDVLFGGERSLDFDGWWQQFQESLDSIEWDAH